MPRFLRVTFLRALRHPLTAPFWQAVERDYAGAPNALQELARGDSSVVCDSDEARASLALGAPALGVDRERSAGLRRHREEPSRPMSRLGAHNPDVRVSCTSPPCVVPEPIGHRPGDSCPSPDAGTRTAAGLRVVRA